MTKGVLVPSYRSRVAYQAMLLGGMATLASATLVLGDLETRGAIAERRAEDLKASLSQVVPEQLHDNDLLDAPLTAEGPDGKPLTVYRAETKGQVSAVAFEVVGQGYAGTITCIMGLDRNGNVLGVRVIAHAETPGLGDKIEPAKDDWINRFNGRSLTDPDTAGWAVKKDGGIFDQFSGATITPRAVVNAVHGGLTWFEANRARLLQPEPITEVAAQ